MKKNNSLNKSLKYSLAILAFGIVSACSSPEEIKQEHYENGMELLEENDLIKASIEFRNALQIDENFVSAWYGMALIEEENEEWQRYIAILRKIIELEPTHIDAQVKLGNFMVMANQLDEAVRISDAVLLLNNQNADALALKAAVQLKLEDAEGAIEYANNALSIDKANLNAIQILAAERFTKENYSGAIEIIDQGLAENEGNKELYLIKIQTYEAMNDFNSAERTYQELIELIPDDKDVNMGLVNFYVRNDRTDSAEQQLRKIAQDDPEDFDASMNVVRFINASKGEEAAVAELQSLSQQGINVAKYQLALAQLYTESGRANDAKNVLQSLVEQTGSSEDGLIARQQLVSMEIREGNIDEAKSIIEDILAIDASNGPALEMRAALLIEENKYEEAIQDLRIALSENPESVRGSTLMSKAYELNGSIELADDAMADALRFSDNNPTLGLAYAEFLMKNSSQNRADEIVTDLANSNPNNLEVLKALAQIKLMQQDWLTAQQIADRIAQIDAEDSVAQEITGIVQRGQQNHDASIEAFQNAYSNNKEASGRPLSSLISAYVGAGKVDEAKTFLNGVLAENGDNYQALNLLGQLQLMTDEREKAVETFNKAISANPSGLQAYSNLVTDHLRHGEMDLALDQIDKSLSAVEDQSWLLMTKANIFERQKKYDDAIETYEALYAYNPNSDVAVNNLASMLSEHKDDPESLNRALNLAQRFRQSSIPHFKDTLGWIYYKLGDIQSASNLLQDAVEMMPNVPIFRYHLAKSYMAEERSAAARTELERIVSLSERVPVENIEEVKQLLADIQPQN